MQISVTVHFHCVGKRQWKKPNRRQRLSVYILPNMLFPYTSRTTWCSKWWQNLFIRM